MRSNNNKKKIYKWKNFLLKFSQLLNYNIFIYIVDFLKFNIIIFIKINSILTKEIKIL